MAKTKLHTLWNRYPAIKHELGSVISLIEDSINLEDSDVKKAIIGMVENGGKMLRPAYTLLMSSFYTDNREKMIGLAAAIETLHTASLIHDDIIDNAQTRRHQVSLQHQFGKDTAVYAGDYLFVIVFQLLSHYHNDLDNVKNNIGYLNNILRGELQQKASRYNYDMDITTYLQQIEGKTAELFILAATIGANDEGASQAFIKLAQDIGHNIGMAFQILDDILDYDESSQQIGKPTLEDLKQGVYSAPLIYAMNSHASDIIPVLKKQTAITNDEALIIDKLVRQYGVPKAKKLADDYTRAALNDIQKLPAHPAKQTLLKLTAQLLKRKV
ncbi:heptaprenyl diphosphate synthase [Weissella beninensis]|uniref:Polyprenyl synthetase family protein n=1 Tax=Periweissella beninensis TaxID=504936 RepID=A0ABT0VIS1_9LACO|nr:polyprenyl synthetase family protein [Periweissella beninensis]MBM7544358.1 heptaprenyl diphosphate synthase [Periweissella beninensis]MCM2437733.1 polyprenyl synthetase family protein [Periweissella beninensis]